MTATSRVAALIEERINRNRELPDEEFDGNEWWQVNAREELVFDLAPDRVRRLGVVWGAYEHVAGVDEHFDELDGDLIAAFCQEHPFMAQARGGDMPEISWRDFVAFGALFGCRHRDCVAWYWKNFFWHDRQGHYD
ncbi:hypothetical protein [Afifella marina]|uniref:Uncharacterized protein n=1 Tax=Afifella marina DSM 2698 TaxID=1120955 RepID=A0A1G5N9J6_AFIMA|nr:hypothetical protein [Afifella marina]MBK1623099.1 hypothetical protein [Afifella marina DSM 2698]MBK1626093.1 hypothetical protein [Afifella marina]MBK5916971.1 hypothetical protein [Afifella marina]RAI21974.1 hypothetical protein CH311_04435 [Afifella marina DSM 2698]SCZ34073.1 hypothetical protein SAMN03080610_01631 [Afifella marina DSM 2698]